MIQKVATLIRSFEDELPLMQLLGPFCLLCTLTLAMKTGASYNFDLLALAIVGLFLTAKWEVRGAVYALALLALSSFAKHLFFTENHAIQFGLEASMGFALLIAGMTAQEGNLFLDSLTQKIGAKEQTIQNLEETIVQLQAESSKEQIAATEKISALSQTVEEVQADSSALQVLNEVLRKSTAKALEEHAQVSEHALHTERKCALLQQEVDALQKELARIGNESALAAQNDELFAELNSARMKEAQTHLINETLVRLHAKEAQKVKDLEGKIAVLNVDCEQVKENLSFARAEAEMSNKQLEQLAAKLQVSEEMGKVVEAVRSENAFYKERIAQAQDELRQKEQKVEHLAAQLQTAQEKDKELQSTRAELERLQTETAAQIDSQASLSKSEAASLVAERDHLLGQLAELREHLNSHAKIEALHRQLKAQFEEKNTVLHQTRAQLFQVDTQLQTVKQELEQKLLEADPVPLEVRVELTKLEEENRTLAEENQLLEDVVTHLMNETPDFIPLAVKKKVKKKLLPDQETLF